VSEFQASDVHQAIFESQQPPAFTQVFARRLLYEVGSYGPFIVTATFTAMGRLSRICDSIHGFAAHLLDEVPHPNLAMEGFLQLGGSEFDVQERVLSPAAFALASVCFNLAERCHPASYLGYIYLLESTTVVLAPRLRNLLNIAQLEVPFVTVHAEEDVAHTSQIAMAIDSLIETTDDDTSTAIDSGFDYFKAVYPYPIWHHALQRTLQELSFQKK
jgi:hypothetical protein